MPTNSVNAANRAGRTRRLNTLLSLQISAVRTFASLQRRPVFGSPTAGRAEQLLVERLEAACQRVEVELSPLPLARSLAHRVPSRRIAQEVADRRGQGGRAAALEEQP